MLINTNSIERVVNISKDLLEVDDANKKVLTNFIQYKNSSCQSFLQLSSLLREDLEKLKSNYIYFTQIIENSFKKISSSLVLLTQNTHSAHSPYTNPIFHFIKQVLLRVLPPEIIEAKKSQACSKVKESLQEYLKLKPLDTILHPQNTDQNLKVLSEQYKSVLHYLEGIAEELLDYYKSNTVDLSRNTFIKDTRLFADEPNKLIDKVSLDTSKKKLQTTITSILKRGSLTDCEANRLLKHVDKPPALITNSGSSILDIIKGTEGSEDSPLTETRIISGESPNYLEKRIKKPLRNSKLIKNSSKRGLNSLSSLTKKRNSNSSLYKPASISVKSRTSSSSHKLKAKSPHSYTYD